MDTSAASGQFPERPHLPPTPSDHHHSSTWELSHSHIHAHTHDHTIPSCEIAEQRRIQRDPTKPQDSSSSAFGAYAPRVVHGKGSSSRICGKGREEKLLFGCGMVCGQQRPTPWLMNAAGFGLASHPLVRVQCVAAGGKHALLVDGAGEVWIWKVNTSGQLSSHPPASCFYTNCRGLQLRSLLGTSIQQF